MTLQETSAVMDVLTVAYPQFYKKQSEAERLMAAKLWAEMFAADDVRIVLAAVKALINASEKSFPPVIGEVKAKIRLLTEPKEMSEAEAWALVIKAVRNGMWGSREEFDALPEDIQRIVGSPRQLSDWGKMDSGTLHSVVASNFQRVYRARAAQRKEYDALPTDVKHMMAKLGSGMSLDNRALPPTEEPEV